MKTKDPRRGILIALICVFTLLLVGQLALACFYNGGEPALDGADFPARVPDDMGTIGLAPDPGEDFSPADGGRPENFGTPEGRENARQGTARDGALATLRRWWLPVALLCGAADGVCVFLLAGLKKKKSRKPHGSDMPELETEDDIRRPKKSSASIVTAVALLLTLALIVASLPSGGDAGTVVNTQVLSAGQESASISTVLSGTGTLAAAEGTAAQVPDSVSVECYHVKNGDTVETGDALASVSRTETASAIAELQNVLEELDKDLNEQRDKTADTAVKASASGRVKAIFVEPGDSAADVMYDRGALMLLSLDGLMAVDIPAGDLKAGDSVTVTLSNGAAQPGRVSQILDGTATVTTADDTAPCDDPVFVTDSQGQNLGAGNLYIHSQLKVTGFSGTVRRVQTALNRNVNAGAGLITLEDTGPTYEYYRLLARRQELEETMTALIKLNRDGFLRAECPGQVSGIPEDGDYAPLASAEEKLTASGLASEQMPRIVLLFGGGMEQPPENPDTPQDPVPASATYAASVSAISGSAMILNITSEPVDLTVMDARLALTLLPTQPISYTYDEATPLTDGEGNPLTVSQLAQEDILVISVSMDDGGNISITSIRRACQGQPEMPEDPSQGGTTLPGGITIPGGLTGFGGLSGFGGMSGGAGTDSQEVYDTYSTGKTEVLTITPLEEMTVSIQVDELDVLSLETGLDAQITLDALEGQSFEGTVTAIAREGVNEGGNTKFTVEITLPRQARMLPGMNASVKIVTAVSDPVPTLPAGALVEVGGRTCVYLGYDEKKDQLTDLTEVQTGLSDGERVQILSGMPEDGTVYYRYADTVVYSFTNG